MATKRRAEALTTCCTIRLSPAERLRAEAAARVNHQPLSTFVRVAVDTAAGECLEAVPGSRSPR